MNEILTQKAWKDVINIFTRKTKLLKHKGETFYFKPDGIHIMKRGLEPEEMKSISEEIRKSYIEYE